MKYLFNDSNLVNVATISADGTVASSSIFETDQDEKQGSAHVELTGPYTGEHDTQIGIRIVDGDGDSSQTSQPILTGVGTGTLDDLAVTGLPAQDVTIQLEDLGTQTTAALAPFQGVLLQAAPGVDGNLISLSVDPSAIIRSTLPLGTLHAAISAGTNTYSGPQYDGFGAVALNADGTIPDNAPRIQFGTDPQVFRAVKQFNFTTNAFDFIFSPTPVRDVEANTNVYGISGEWAITITDGITPETYTGIVTCYDALIGIRTSSALVVSIVPAPNNDKTVNGQGSTDLSVWTQPYILGITSDGTDFVKQADFGVTITNLAPTSTLGISCIDDSILGGEIWELIDGVNIGLPNATTGIAYAAGPYALLIPVQVPQSTQPNGNIAVDFNFAPRAPEAPQPSGRVVEAVLGALAQNTSYTFTLVKKPAADCDEDSPTGNPRFECLGIQPEGGGPMSEARTIARQQMLAAAVRDIVGSNTPSNPANSPFYIDRFDIDTVIATAGDLQSCVIALEAATPNEAWAAGATIEVDEVRESVNRNGYRFRAIVGGTTGGSEPTWDTAIGEETVDNTVTWLNVGRVPYDMFDIVFGQWYSEMKALYGFEQTPTFLTRADSTDYFYGQTLIPATRNGHAYGIAKPGTSAGSAPTFKTDGTAFADGTALLVDLGPYWTPGAFVFSGSRVIPGNGFVYRADAAGNFFTGATEPDWSSAATEGATLTDGTQTWDASRRMTNTDADTTDEYLQRWRSATADVLAAAGITPTFKSASVNGDGCWQDYGDNANWFKNTDGPLLPFQQGHGYHSAKLQLDPVTGQLVPTTTEEFFIKLAFRCDLAIGDSFTVSISGVSGGTKAYRVGDVKDVAMVHADPLQFGGGQNGNDLQVWAVNGSVTNFAPFLRLMAIPANRANTHAYIAGDKYKPVTPNAHWYICTVAGTSASSVPTLPTDGSSFADGTATFQDAGLIDGYSNAGLSFSITEGGIPFGLLDAFGFSIEGGHFQWNQDGGAFSSPIVIADTLLVDGITVTFAGGVSPSYVADDEWTFEADAINGPDKMKKPTDGRFSWIGSTTIDLAVSGQAEGLLIADHTIPDTATIALQGSNDSFATTVVDEDVTWVAANIWHDFDRTTAAAWRLVITMGGSDPGSIYWLWLGDVPDMKLPNGLVTDIGILTKNYRLADDVGTREGVGYEVQHEQLGKTSWDAFIASLNRAKKNDQGYFGLIPNPAEAEGGVVQANIATLQVKDLRNYQPRDPKDRRHGFTLQVDPL